MQDELKKEKAHGDDQFTGILSRVESGPAISLVVPVAFNEATTGTNTLRQSR